MHDEGPLRDLERAAMANGVKDGHQMSRFMLWVANECFEGREVESLMVLSARAPALAKMFLAQDKEPTSAAAELPE